MRLRITILLVLFFASLAFGNNYRVDIRKTRNVVSGTFFGENIVAFRSEAVSANRVDVSVRLNEMVLTAAIDYKTQKARMRAISLIPGKKPQMTMADRKSILGALRAIEQERKKSRVQLTNQHFTLEKALNLWADWPETVSLNRTIRGQNSGESRTSAPSTITSLCSWARCLTPNGYSYFGPCVDSSGNSTMVFYQYASHDCYKGGFSTPVNQQRASLGDHYRCSGDEFYWTGSTWRCGEPDHWYRPYVTGNCFGRCGGDCGEVGIYTVDCTNHDGCVRNGHALTSPYCDDQFVSASDDYLFGTPCYTSTP